MPDYFSFCDDICSHFNAAVDDSAETHSWTLRIHNTATSSSEDLAAIIADAIMRYRCRGCPQHYQLWRERVDSGAPLVGGAHPVLEAIIGPAFGLPGIERPADHLEGLVAEHLWFFIVQQGMDGERIEHIEGPGVRATDAGGDGLVIHRGDAGELLFRLWEIKKATGAGEVSATVTKAYGQLKERALRYLAEYTTIAATIGNDEVASFIARMIEAWVNAAPEAAAGVAVTTSVDKVPERCFTTFGTQFPNLVVPKRLRGMLTALDGLPAFSVEVKEAVWKGL